MTNNTSFKQIFKVNSTPVYWLETVEEVALLGDILKKDSIKVLAIDQERAPYNKYYHQIPCLLQIATQDLIAFIDLLNDRNISEPIRNILEDPSINKIFFDAPWDLYYFREYMNMEITGIKDIQVASSLLYPTIGTASLISLVKDEYDIDIKKSKKQQKSDWTKRPLKNQQIEYASNEIAWFIPVYEALINKLRQKDLFPFFQYGNGRIPLEVPHPEYLPMNIRRIKGYDTLSNKEKHKLIQLGIIRDHLAQEWNRPVFHVLTNQQLLNLSRKGTRLQMVLTPRQRFSKKAVNQITRVIEATYPDTPLETTDANSKNTPQLKQLLLNWRYNASKKHKIPKRFIISANEIEEFNEQVFTSEDDLLKTLWFIECQKPKCKLFTSDLQEYLRSNSS
ncbi:hypothetical protein CEE45_08275 [Candidatus Heimdallarchaeota archaeon B3_Heim]|nr:MAG: hypothetical protein CEE45_08275 [Candidatus Heimdallarchaeota archaeon B3_Heim]